MANELDNQSTGAMTTSEHPAKKAGLDTEAEYENK